MMTARDTFVKHIEQNISSSIPVKVFTTPQQKLELNALNIRFLGDMQLIGRKMWELQTSLDLLVDNSNANDAPERLAAKWQEELMTALAAGRTTEVYIDSAWINGSYIAWTPIDGLRFVNIPSESYVHKHLTLKVTYFM